jgi:hypothetical protein
VLWRRAMTRLTKAWVKGRNEDSNTNAGAGS